MSGASRTVRSLRLRAPSAAAVRRTANVLEDALRTASLPDGGGRMLLVRRLALGRLAADAPAASIALALERAVARAAGEWRHGASTEAGAAAVVWFRDPLDAHLALAQRLLSGSAPREWYWSLSVPRWTQGPRLGEALREIAFSLAALDEAPAALPQWFAALVGSGHGELLAAALREEDVAPLARAAAVSFGPPGRPRTAAAPAAADASPRPDAPRVPAPARGRAVHRLIAAMLRAAGGPSVSASFAAAEKATRIEPGSMPVWATSAPSARAGDAVLALGPGAATRADLRDPVGGDPPSLIRVVREAPGANAEARNDWQAGRTSAVPVPVTTSAGGLLFLLNALARIGYAAWIAEQPAWARHDVARRVLGRVLARLDVAAADPVRRALETRPLPATHPRRFAAPSSWRDGLLSGEGPLLVSSSGGSGRLHDASGRLLLGAWRGPRPQALLQDCRRATRTSAVPGRLDAEVVEAWDVALRRWARRYAEMGLAELVLRPGRLTATPTHVDARFELGAAGLRVRRAGLDLDPGWLPWFGRVVTFHYDSAGEP